MRRTISFCWIVLGIGMLAASVAQAQVPPPAPPAAAPVRAAAVIDTSKSISGIPSIMYRSEDAKKIRRALEIYRRSLQPVAVVAAPVKIKEEDDFLSKIAKNLNTGGTVPGKIEAPKTFVFPKFYMESMMWYSPSNWVVWLGGKKFTTLKPVQGEVEVELAETSEVTFVWRPTNMAAVIEASNKYVLERSPGIQIDEAKALVKFTLSLNQTFYPEQMKILEGKYLPPPPPEPKPIDATVKPATDAASKPETGAPSPNQGLQGLQNMYSGQLQENIKKATQ